MTNSTALSNTFDDHFSTIGPKLACEIPLKNSPSFQKFKYLWPLKQKIPNSSPHISRTGDFYNISDSTSNNTSDHCSYFFSCCLFFLLTLRYDSTI